MGQDDRERRQVLPCASVRNTNAYGYGDSHTYANSHSHGDSHPYTDSHGDSYPHTNGDRHGNGHSDSDSDCASSVTNSHSYAQTYADSKTSAHAT